MKASTLLSMTMASLAGCSNIDTHHHAIPPVYVDALNAAGGDPSGFPTPGWSVNGTIDSMKRMDTSVAILSISPPGAAIAGVGDEAKTLSRNLNEYFGSISGPVEGRTLGFFGALPDWRDVQGTLSEIDYLYTCQKICHGVAVSSSYGDKLLGDPEFAPIWDRLNHYKALVFMHPTTMPGVMPEFLADGLPAPIVDYPLATTRSAIDLVFSGRMDVTPDVDVILSHAGGTIPFIGTRAIGSLTIPEVSEKVNTTLINATKAFSRFYYDIALSTSNAQLHGLLDFTDPSKILFGTDYPYAPQSTISLLNSQYDLFVLTDQRGRKIRPEVLANNAQKLLSKHEQARSPDTKA